LRIFAVVLCIEILLALWLLGVMPRRGGLLKDRLYALVLSHVLMVLFFVAGGELDYYYRWWERYGGWKEARVVADPFLHQGDPSLVKRVASMQPRLVRPSFDDRAAFVEWRESLRRTLRDEIFKLPAVGQRPPPYRILHTERLQEGVERHAIVYRADDGTEIPAYLFYPARAERSPAVLVLSGHGVGIWETAIQVESYQRAAAYQLARAGFVTLTPELRGFGHVGSEMGAEHQAVISNAILAGSFYKAVIAADLVRATDLLASLPRVQRDRIAVTGVSFGGEMSVAYAALDTRIAAVVVQGYGGETLGAVPGVSRSYGEPLPEGCHTIPGQNEIMRHEDMFLLVAPRPLLIVRGTQDGGGIPSWNEFSEVMTAGYSSMGATHRFRAATAEGGHEYFVQPTVEFLTAQFRLE
jgi:dienelactone hydrolase